MRNLEGLATRFLDCHIYLHHSLQVRRGMNQCATKFTSMLMLFSCVSLLPVQNHFRTLKINGCLKYGVFAQKVMLQLVSFD